MSLLRQKLVQQPQWAAQIDWSNPLCKGLILAVNAAVDPVRNLAGLGVLSKTGAGYSDRTIGKSGRRATANSSNCLVYTPPRTLTEATLIVVGKTQIGLGSGPWKTNGTDVDWVTYTDSNIYLGTFSSSRWLSSVAFPSGSNPENFVLACRGSGSANSHAAFIDGKVLGTANATFYCDSSITIGSHVYAEKAFSSYLYLLYERALSDTEIKLISESPWQIFKAPQPTLFGASGPSPQLLAPTGSVVGSSWLSSTGGSTASCVNESSPDDATYEYTLTPGAWEEHTFDNGGAVSAAGGRVRYRIPAGAGSITVELRQGATVLQTWGPHTLTGSLQAFDQLITASTSDSNDLRVRFTAS